MLLLTFQEVLKPGSSSDSRKLKRDLRTLHFSSVRRRSVGYSCVSTTAGRLNAPRLYLALPFIIRTVDMTAQLSSKLSFIFYDVAVRMPVVNNKVADSGKSDWCMFSDELSKGFKV